MLNSLYGATANKYFRWFDLRLAKSITLTGQTMIRYISARLDELLNKELGTEGVEFTIINDTDSVTGDTIITVNGNNISIEDYYNNLNNNFIINDEFNENYVKKVENDKTLSVNINNKIIEEKNITYIKKHKTNKELFKITIEGKTVIITEDHSIMVERNGNIIECKPREIVKGDKIIYK